MSNSEPINLEYPITFFEDDDLTALEAINEAQKIAFGPIVFQAVRVLLKKGILKCLHEAKNQGITISEIASKTNVNEYGCKVLLESALGAGICKYNGEKYFINKLGLFLLNDKMTSVNFNFTNDICYQAMWYLEESIDQGKPVGLQVLGPWDTIYQGLSSLPEPAHTSWFDFDHYYSDQSFKNIIESIFTEKPKNIFDVGGNTGKFSIVCAQYNDEIEITICDLPIQLEAARKYLSTFGLENRINRHALNVLEPVIDFPGKTDAIMMSQFLDCFSPVEIIHILRQCASTLNEDGSIYIIENFWDRQKFELSAFALQQTSLYFTALANGNSKMYHSKDFFNYIDAAGLEIVEILDNLGICHTFVKCKLKK